MSRIDWHWWIEQVGWTFQAALRLAPTEHFPEFAADVRVVAERVAQAFEDAPFGKPLRLLQWALLNRDPLRPAREWMKLVRARWEEVA